MSDPETRNAVVAILLVTFGIFATAFLAIATDVTEGFLDFSVAQTLLAGGAVASGLAWLAALAVVRVVRQPREPRPGPSTDDFRPEPPALANMLVNGFKVTRSALPATLVDLAARKVIDIERRPGGGSLIRIKGLQPEQLTHYERALVLLLQQKAIGGTLPAEALTLGPRQWAAGWWRSFRGAVEKDAQDRGLSRNIWDPRTLRVFAFAAAIPTILTGLATVEVAGGIFVGIAAAAILGTLKGRKRQRDTQAGREAAAAWLGVRRHLRDAASFPYLPPGAVVVWERHLAYGVALGAAPGVERELPMGADSDHEAWTHFGGTWREVRVRYPRLWPPGWGWHPGVAIVVPLAVAAVAGGLLWLAGELRGLETGPGFPRDFVFVMQVVRTVLLIVATLALLWAAFLLTLGLLDLRKPVRIDGVVVRRRVFGEHKEDSRGRYYVAVDDGTTDRIRALRVSQRIYAGSGVGEGSETTLFRTPWLGYVRHLSPPLPKAGS